jgi:L-iditol 2-dehydrogenase
LAGAAKVLITQRSRYRLALACERFSIDRAIVSSEEDLERAVLDETEGEGADVVFVCAPSRAAQETALRLAANRGRINFFGGLPNDDHTVALDANAVHYKELFISGASSSLPEGNRRALALLASRQVDPDLLITHRFSLEHIHEAFDVAESGHCLKVVVNPGRPEG